MNNSWININGGIGSAVSAAQAQSAQIQYGQILQQQQAIANQQNYQGMAQSQPSAMQTQYGGVFQQAIKPKVFHVYSDELKQRMDKALLDLALVIRLLGSDAVNDLINSTDNRKLVENIRYLLSEVPNQLGVANGYYNQLQGISSSQQQLNYINIIQSGYYDCIFQTSRVTGYYHVGQVVSLYPGESLTFLHA